MLAAELAPHAGTVIEPDEGFARVAPGELDGADDVLTAANDLIDRTGANRLEDLQKKPMSKGFLPMDDLERESAYLRFALSDAVVAAASTYLNVVPVLTYVDVWFSAHLPREPFSSQLWHLDHADITQVKVFLHCDDVDLASGPLTVLASAASLALAKRIGYTFAASRLSDDAVREFVGAGPGDPVGTPLAGPKGSAAMVDTSRCFHFGSRVEAGAPPRKLVVFQYLTPFAFAFKDDHRQEAPFRDLADARSSERDRLVLGAD